MPATPSQFAASSTEEALPGVSRSRITNRPIFHADKKTNVEVEHENLSAVERLEYRNTEISAVQRSITRRDHVYQSLASDYYGGANLTAIVMGTPYPVIEPLPHVTEAFQAVRWYEYALSLASGVGLQAIATSWPNLRSSRAIGNWRVAFPLFISVSWASAFAMRGENRLLGNTENEYEADKYGIYDSKENLERKARNWAKYAAYKESWMRQYNYVVGRERPGEAGGILSFTYFPYVAVTFNTRTDYPLRKNPMALSTIPLRNQASQFAYNYDLPRSTIGTRDPYQAGRPELTERYRTPLHGIDRVGA